MDWKLNPGETVKVVVGQKDGPIWKDEWNDIEWEKLNKLRDSSYSNLFSDSGAYKLTQEETRLLLNGPREHPFGYGALYVDIDGRIAIFRNEVVYSNWKRLQEIEEDGPIWQDEWDAKIKEYGPRPFPFGPHAWGVIIDGRTAVFRSEDAYLKWKRIKEIEAIPDEKIDTSDIPEAGEDFFKHARLRKMTRVMAQVTTTLGTTEVPVPGDGTLTPEDCIKNLSQMTPDKVFLQIGPHAFFLKHLVDIYFYTQEVAVAETAKFPNLD